MGLWGVSVGLFLSVEMVEDACSLTAEASRSNFTRFAISYASLLLVIGERTFFQSFTAICRRFING